VYSGEATFAATNMSLNPFSVVLPRKIPLATDPYTVELVAIGLLMKPYPLDEIE
jgi:hypothetical protein